MESFEQHLKEFVEFSTSALQTEDEFLRKAFSQYVNTQHYGDWPHGITILFETTLVYFIFRELLSRKFPLEVLWEHEYPSNRSLKADLALRDIRGGMLKEQAFLEFKIWKSDTTEEISTDIKKLKDNLGDYKEAPTQAFVFIFWWEPEQNEEDNLKWLENELGIDLFKSSSFRTKWKGSSYRMATLALFEVRL